MARPRTLVLIALMAVVACERDHGTARRVAEAPPPVTPLPPPTDGPSCDEIAAHLGALAGGVVTGTAEVDGIGLAAPIDLGAAARDATFDWCRRARWTAPQKACALAWQGSILRQAAELRARCGLEPAR